MCSIFLCFVPFPVEPKLVLNYLQTLKSSEEALKEQVRVDVAYFSTIFY